MDGLVGKLGRVSERRHEHDDGEPALEQGPQRLLVTLGNYEVEPLDELEVKLDLKKLGLKGEVFAEDAVTLNRRDPAPTAR
jgi:hypothetical protein